MHRALALVVLAACGAPATSGPRGPAHQVAGGTPTPPAAAAPTRAHLCEKARALQAASCSPFDHMAPSLVADCSVADSLFISGTQACVDAASCDAVQACMLAVSRTGAPYLGPTSACALPAAAANTIPAGVTAAELAASYGHGDHTFGDSPSSAKQPIEVCGMPEETGYLTRVTCADGSHPFADRAAADDSRTGNVGEGGRCGRVVDQYAVPCPERTYPVFIDPYRCLARADPR